MKHLLTFTTLFLLGSSLNSQVITQNFDNGMPAGWKGVTSYDFDYVTENGGKIDLFKQSDGPEPLLLVTEQYDLSKFTRLEIDVAGFNLSFVSTTVPELHIGNYHPNSDCCFEPIHTIFVPNNTPETITIDIASVEISTALVFKLEGNASHIINIDNFKLYDESYENNIAEAVMGLHLEPRIAPEPGFDRTFWISPKKEADGDLLPDLTSIDFVNLADNSLSYSFPNPSPGENYMPAIDVEGDPGYYQFEVFGKNDAGKGYVRFTKKMWLGLDTPGAVTNLVATKTGDDILLEWTAPTSGSNIEQNGGSYFDNIVDEYTIVRSDGKEFVIPGDETTFTDVLDVQGSITYTLIPENSSGPGTAATSNIIYRVEDDFLYYENFDVNVVERSSNPLNYDFKWTTQSTTTAALWGYFSSNLAGGDNGEMAYLWGGGNSNVVRAISPIINTSGLPAISIEFLHSIDFPLDPNYYLALETSSDGGNTWNEVSRWQETAAISGAVIKTIGNSDVGSENFQFAITVHGNSGYANFARYDNIRVYYQPSVDLAVLESEMISRAEPGQEIDIIGKMENRSTDLISGFASCEIRERFGSNTVETFSIDVDDIFIGEVVDINFGTWIAEEGEYELVFKVETPGDQNTDNDTYVHHLDILNLVDRDKVLIEEFTGTWCSYCPGAALGIHDLFEEGLPVAAIAYHRNDDYETSTTQSKIDLYTVLGFPTVVFDGQLKIASGHPTNSVVGLYRPVVTDQRSVRTPAELTFYGSEVKGNYYEAWIDITSPSQILNPNYILRVALIENEIEEEWLGLSELEIVEKAYFEVPINLSGLADREFVRMEIPDDMVTANSEAVAWIQSTETNEVFNAEKIRLSETITSNEELTTNEISVYPNPANETLTVVTDMTASYSILNTSGQIMLTGNLTNHENRIQIEDLTAGIYILELLSDQQLPTDFIKFVKQ